MEKRNSKRLRVRFDAEIISGDGSLHGGTIKNISRNATGCSLITMVNSKGYVPTLKTFSLNFQTDAAETLFLDCRIKWLTKILKGDDKGGVVLGLEIIAPNQQFISFVDALYDAA